MAFRILPSINLKKKNYQIWLILQYRIIIPVERIFAYKITMALGP